jgi:hypothetical protein
MSGMTTPTVQAMMAGMLVIVVPAFLVVCGITFMAYRRRDKSADE